MSQGFACLRILGARIDAISFESALHAIERAVLSKAFAQIITVNPLMLDQSTRDPELQSAFEEAAWVVPESVGIALLARLKGLKISERIPGIDLMTELCKRAGLQGWKVYLLGGSPGVAEQARVHLQSLIPNLKIAGTHHGYFNAEENESLLRNIESIRPDLLFVGLAVPEQEKWIYRNKKRLGAAVAMGVGGSFDVISGRLRRAPGWMRTLGLEWLFRTLQEPFRVQRIFRIPGIIFTAILSPAKIENSSRIS